MPPKLTGFKKISDFTFFLSAAKDQKIYMYLYRGFRYRKIHFIKLGLNSSRLSINTNTF